MAFRLLLLPGLPQQVESHLAVEAELYWAFLLPAEPLLQAMKTSAPHGV